MYHLSSPETDIIVIQKSKGTISAPLIDWTMHPFRTSDLLLCKKSYKLIDMMLGTYHSHPFQQFS
jgi:hypothetical protein